MKAGLWLLIVCAALLVGCATARMNHRVAQMSTPELKLRRGQLTEEIAKTHGWLVGDQIEEKQAIERELLKRYQLGDKSADLQDFHQ